MSSINPPTQTLLINDKTFVNAEVDSVDSYSGLKLTTTVADNDNNGNLSLFCIDNNPSTKKDFEFRIQSSGSFDQASYIWQEQESDEWYGEQDRRILGNMVRPTKDIAYNATGLYAHKLNKIFCYYGESENTLGIASKSVDGTTWVKNTFDFTSTDASLGADDLVSQSGVLDAVVLPNDKILMVVRYERDLYLYISEDGLNFELYSPSILSRFTDITSSVTNVKMACSGNYVRIVGVIEPRDVPGLEDGGHYIFSLVSPDRGSSWSRSTFTKVAYQKEATGDDRFSIDLVPYDNNGTFLLALLGDERTSTSTEEVVVGSEVVEYGEVEEVTETVETQYTEVDINAYEIHIATSTNQFSKLNNLRLKPGVSIQNIYLCNHSDWIVAITCSVSTRNDVAPDPTEEVTTEVAFGSGTLTTTSTVITFTNYEYQLFYISKLENPLNCTWKNLNGGLDITGFLGSARIIPAKGKLFSSTDSMHWFHAMRDKVKPLEYAYVPDSFYTQIGFWTRRPYRDINVGNFNGSREFAKDKFKINRHDPVGRAFRPQWNTALGSPAGGMWGSYDSIWTMNRNPGGTYGRWESLEYQIQGLSNATYSDYLYFQYIDRSYLNRTSKPNDSTTAGITDYGTGEYLHDKESPDRNWCFIPYNDGTFGPEYNNAPHGSCVVWEGRFDDSVHNGTTRDFMVVGMSSYARVDIVNFTPVYKKVNCVVRHSKDKVVLYDNEVSAPLATITPDTGIYGTEPFKDSFWEFRWAWYPYSTDTNKSTQCILMCRKTGTEEWLSTDMIDNIAHSANSNIEILNQTLYFGNLSSRPNIKSEWKNVGIHNNNDLGTFSYEQANIAPITNVNTLDIIRGKTVSDSPDVFYTEEGTKAVWGGASGHYNDRYLGTMGYNYPATNINTFQSPRIQYRSEDTDLSIPKSPEIVFKSNNDDLFYHNAVSIINCNVREVGISYSMDGTSYGTEQVVNFERTQEGLARVQSVNDNIIEIALDPTDFVAPSEFISTDDNKYYLRFDTSTSGSNQVMEIKSSFGKNILLINTDNMNIDSSDLNSTLVGSSVSIYSDRAYRSYGDSMYGKYMKVTIKSAHQTAENYAYLGSIVVGQRYEFDVPLSWEYSDNEKANQTRFRTRSGIQWSYNQGPAERELQLTMIGDVSEQKRRELREQLKGLSGYGERNLVFVTAPSNDSSLIFHGMPNEQTQFQNQGWYYDEASRTWMPVGDLSITLIEIK